MRGIRGRWLVRAVVAFGLALVALGSACTRPSTPQPPGYQSAVRPFAPPLPVPRDDPAALMAGDPDALMVNGSLDQLVASSQGFAVPLPDAPPSLLAEVERLFVALGRLEQLLTLYQARVAAEGPGSEYAPRLAVLLGELGYRDEAWSLIEGALAGEPVTPEAEVAAAIWVLEGAEPGDAERIEAARHLLRGAEGYHGIYTYTTEWPADALARLPFALRRAAEGDGVPLAARDVSLALAAARAATAADGTPPGD